MRVRLRRQHDGWHLSCPCCPYGFIYGGDFEMARSLTAQHVERHRQGRPFRALLLTLTTRFGNWLVRTWNA